jgi:hypothetical protein
LRLGLVVVSSLPATEETGAIGREIESRQKKMYVSLTDKHSKMMPSLSSVRCAAVERMEFCTILFDNFVRQFCPTILFDNFVRQFCSTILFDNFVRQFCSTISIRKNKQQFKSLAQPCAEQIPTLLLKLSRLDKMSLKFSSYFGSFLMNFLNEIIFPNGEISKCYDFENDKKSQTYRQLLLRLHPVFSKSVIALKKSPKNDRSRQK